MTDVVIDGAIVRDLDTVTFEDLTASPYVGWEVDRDLGVYVLHFDGPLTVTEQAKIIRRACTTPEDEADLQLLDDLEVDLESLKSSSTQLQTAGLNTAVKRLAEGILALRRLSS